VAVTDAHRSMGQIIRSSTLSLARRSRSTFATAPLRVCLSNILLQKMSPP